MCSSAGFLEGDESSALLEDLDLENLSDDEAFHSIIIHSWHCGDDHLLAPEEPDCLAMSAQKLPYCACGRSIIDLWVCLVNCGQDGRQ
eukprot:4810691-Amphidinium_carterae.1